MEIEFDGKSGRKGKAAQPPKTRLYAPKSAKASGKGERRSETVVDEDGYRIRIATDEIKPMSRFGLILCAFVFAGMLLFTLSGYERITRAHADINALNDEIELTNLRITGLDVQIECAVTIQQAQEAAARFGMQYPQQAQYVGIGEYIPISGTYTGAGTAADTAPAGNGTTGTGEGTTPTTPAANPDAGGGADTLPEAPRIPDASEDLTG